MNGLNIDSRDDIGSIDDEDENENEEEETVGVGGDGNADCFDIDESKGP